MDDWKARAECVGMTDLFFPTQGEDSDQAKRVCQRCEVRPECYRACLEGGDGGEGERFGIWAGLSARERKNLRRSRTVGLPPIRLRDYELTRFSSAVVIDLDGRRRSA